MCTYTASAAPPSHIKSGASRPRGKTVPSYGYSHFMLPGAPPAISVCTSGALKAAGLSAPVWSIEMGPAGMGAMAVAPVPPVALLGGGLLGLTGITPTPGLLGLLPSGAGCEGLPTLDEPPMGVAPPVPRTATGASALHASNPNIRTDEVT